MSNRPLLKMTNLSKIYRTEHVETLALAEIDVEIDRGEFVVVAGPSGCGKSTLLSVMGLIEPATEGQYFIEGNEVSQFSLTQRARLRNQVIGFVFQNFNLIGDLSVLDNVALPLMYRGFSLRKRRQLATDWLERVGIGHRAKHAPDQLSGGQQQRVAIARAMIGDPMLLLADEPTGNLDSANGESVMALLSEIHAHGTTVCLVTHDDRFAEEAERRIELLDGKVLSPNVGRT